jgi:hypothetical protein
MEESQESDGLLSRRVYIPLSERRFQDVVFLYLYIVAVLGFLISGFQKLKAPAFEHYEILFITTSVSVVISFLWIILVTRLSRLLFFTALVLPVLLILFSVYSFSNLSFNYAFIPYTSTFGILLALFSFYNTIRNKKKFDLLANLWRMTTAVLYEHPSILAFGLLLSLLHMLFSALWLWMFGHLLYSDVTLQMETKITVVFYILMYFWTSAILKNLEKAVIASIVGQWYFELDADDEDWDFLPRRNTVQHIKYVGSRSFGTISLASLLLGLLETMHFVSRRIYSYKLPFLKNRFVKYVMASIISFSEKYTGYVMTFVGISGESLVESAKRVSGLFRRHLVFGLSTSFISALVSIVGKVVVTTSTVFFVYKFYGIRQDMGYEWSFVICSVIPYYILNLCTHVWEST